MEGRYADPAPVGFAALGFILWLFDMFQAGWYTTGIDLVATVAFTLAGVALLLVGVLEFFRGRSLTTVLFVSLGAGWFSYAAGHTWFAGKLTGAVSGWYMILWAVFLFFVWVASLKAGSLPVQLAVLGLWVTAACWAIGSWGVTILDRIGGYVGLATAIVFLYLAAAGVMTAASAEKGDGGPAAAA